MKIDPECIRAILLAVENFDNKRAYLVNRMLPGLQGFSDEEIGYHVQQCCECRLLIGANRALRGAWSAWTLSPAGHNLLDGIRMETVWKRVRDNAEKIGFASLPALLELVTGHILG